MGKQIELIMVTGDNNNKYYRMIENGDGTWTAVWGRVQSTENTKKYPMRDWDKKYREKTGKGYKDVTGLRKVTGKGFVDVTDADFRMLLHILQGYSKQALTENYSISSEQVTQAQIDRAQEILNQLSLLMVGQFLNEDADNLLKELYMTIPRKMKNTRDHLLNGDPDSSRAVNKLREIIQKEQDNVDNMAQAVSTMSASDSSDQAMTLEDALGIKLAHVTDEEINGIKQLMGSDAHRFVRAYAVINHRTQKSFDDHKRSKAIKDWSKLLWHGSRNENWLSILSKGLMIRPTGAVFTGSMFGNGVYFANKAAKSIGYTSVQGSYWAGGRSGQAFLALYDVNTGMEYRTKVRESWMSSCNEQTIRSRNCDSLYCQGGADLRNDEFIVYNHDQSTIRYIVEIRS